MVVKQGEVCKTMSNKETEVHAGSGFCTRCKWFNGKFNKDGHKCISCLRGNV